ncbi:DNA polymerase III subunit delta [Tistrella mobilis]|uniref:DNA-directed DNA polymerase n=1 Tax=Tistrella mobilis TaxID=171437 RepID=A0A162KH11_9PROT|nr:DNA polymerase III subunit delta [Tistrella mobilis]KYO51250.1 DNA polymerase III subunit delta [Tistrella mobilis]
MVKVAPRDAETKSGRPDAAWRAVLVYGPDRGLVKERADRLVRAVVPDPTDPFRIATLDGKTLSDDPARLADEAAAIAFGGGRRVVRLKDIGDAQAPALAGFLDDPAGDALIVVDGGELGPGSKLRKLFETAANAAAIACYADEGRDLAEVIRNHLSEAGLQADADALMALAGSLGADRAMTRMELDKLALYAHGRGRVTLEDVEAVIGDARTVALDDVALAAAGGDAAALDQALDRAFAEGTSAIALLRAVSRHFGRLLQARAEIDAGADPETAMKSLKPPVFFKQTGSFRAALAVWPTAALARALGRLADAEARAKQGLPQETLVGQALLGIAAEAGQRKRRR